jgi:integrase/recombinase XerD
MSGRTPELGPVLASFFNDHLKLRKGLRPNSITSYADALRLLLQFTANVGKKRITQLTLDDLDAETVSSFLNSLEDARSNAISSRNHRLAAIHTFFEYIAQRCPDRLAQSQEVGSIPRKRTQPPDTIFLERDEVEATLAGLPVEGCRALRDRTLLLFLYNTGARVQEASDLRICDVHFNPSPRAYLHGKGDKWRACPLWVETTSLLKQLIAERTTGTATERPVFVGKDNSALTRFGIYKVIRRSTAQLVKQRSDGTRKLVSPHVWRHSTAVHLLEAGVEVNVIRAWLGHARLETTNRYAEITIRTKQAALETCILPSPGAERIPRKPRWRTDATLLEWLQSL